MISGEVAAQQDQKLGQIAATVAKIGHITNGIDQAIVRVDSVSDRLFGPLPSPEVNSATQPELSGDLDDLFKAIARLDERVQDLHDTIARIEGL